MVAVFGEYLDSVRVILVCWFCFQGADVLTEIVVDVVAVRHACDGELKDFTDFVVFWPYGDMVAFVFDAEVLKFLNDWFLHGVAVLVEKVEVNGLL